MVRIAVAATLGLDVSPMIAPFKRLIYAVNARFDRPDDSEDDVIRLRP